MQFPFDLQWRRRERRHSSAKQKQRAQIGTLGVGFTMTTPKVHFILMHPLHGCQQFTLIKQNLLNILLFVLMKEQHIQAQHRNFASLISLLSEVSSRARYQAN